MRQEVASVRVERDGDIAVVIIDNPPINASSLPVRAGVLAVIENIGSDRSVSAVVLIGAGSTFVAGADLREFGQPIASPQLPDVISAIETCGKPVVAALHGAALGGGLELALGCDARVALAGCMLGLPEVTLGIIPGAGGTQRLPRLVGVARAIEMIGRGERIAAEKALEVGLVDHLTQDDLRGAAIAWARNLNGRKARVRDLAVPAGDAAIIDQAAAAVLKAGKNRPAVCAAVESVRAATRLPIDEALSKERAAFQHLRTTREARALRHQFFAERSALKHPGIDGVAALPVGRVAVIGAGAMGAGIAIATLDAGLVVTILERDDAALQKGVGIIDSHYAGRVKAGKLAADEAAAAVARLTPALDWSVAADADLVIEAVFEDLAVKQQVFARLDGIVRAGAILASNTSYIDLDAIARSTSRPQDVVGLHFFSPAHVMRLLEVVRGEATSPQVLATALQFAKRLRKISVLSGNEFGFIGNRIYSAYRRQCEFMLEEGASPEQVDAALESFGFAMGPFAVGDMSGLDIAWRMRQSLSASRDQTTRYVDIPDRLCEAGRLGRKTGAGYYRYAPDGGPRQLDPAVADIIADARAAKTISPRAMDADEITRRALLAIVNEAALVLEEHVAERADDIDVVLVNGYGFPKWQGGPVFWARERGQAALEQDLDWLAGLSGPGFVRGRADRLFGGEG